MDIKEWQGDLITIKVDYDKCSGHGECVRACPGEVYELKDGKTVAVSVFDCVECCTCIEVCPEGAIEHSSCEGHEH